MKEKIVERIQKAIDMEETLSIQMYTKEDDKNRITQFLIPEEVDVEDEELTIYSEGNVYVMDLFDVLDCNDSCYFYGKNSTITLTFEEQM